jgi:cytosine/adenosine deaminase-related metal-dependent hydrolase
LVNAHTHLEFSDCESPIGQAGVPLAEWIGQVIDARSASTIKSKQAAIHAGVAESKNAGVCLIGDIATPPCTYNTDLMDIICFAEVVGLSENRWTERLQAATDYGQSFSPHAPYSTSQHAIDACIRRSKASGKRLSMHIAESPEERELLCNGTGPFAEALRHIGAWQDDLFPWQDEPIVCLIERLAAAPGALLIHGNDLRTHEIAKVATHPNLTVVYCPRTHAFFGYDRHPVAEMHRAGVPVALGTDSKASNPDLNLWSEVQYLMQHRMDIDPAEVLKMATVHGANALGRRDVGRLANGSIAHLGQVNTNASDLQRLYRDLAENEYRPLAG